VTTQSKPQSVLAQMASMPANFWYANLMEIFERLAFYGVRAIAPLYLVASGAENGLGLSYTQKGLIFGVWAVVQCLVPMVSGGYTDRFGFRKSLFVAYTINILGFSLMACSLPLSQYFTDAGWQNAGFWVFLTAACMAGLGTAIFKPAAHGTIARATTEETSSMGWGVFYWVVNLGGFLAPFGAAFLRNEIDWHRVFWGAAVVTAINFLPLIFLYREPEKIPPKPGEEEQTGVFSAFADSIKTILGDKRLMLFLLIFSCFWLMFMQLWDLFPNFIGEWVNTQDVAGIFGWVNEEFILDSGQVKPELIINLDSATILLFVLLLSWVIRKMHKVAAMVLGMSIAAVGFMMAGLTTAGWVCCVGVIVFAIGEILCSPTFSAYCGLIAPPEKKALYMGYSNIPFAIGWAVGNWVSGPLYDRMSSKFNLARDFLVNEIGVPAELARDKDLLPNDQVMETMAYLRDAADPTAAVQELQRALAGIDLQSIAVEARPDRLAEIYTGVIGELDSNAVWDATRVLWDRHDPWMIWIYLGALGVLGIIGMILFYFASPKQPQAEAVSADEDAEVVEGV
jgi:POT family proton-dependent oligopeptide transporter